MILTNNTAKVVHLDMPAAFGGQHLTILPTGTVSIPDDGYFAMRTTFIDMGLSVTQNGVGGGGPAPVQVNNLASVVDPTATDDSASGYTPGSNWINTSAGTHYIASSVGVGVAVWVLVPTNTRKDNLAAVTAPGVSDDASLGYVVGSVWIDTLADVPYTLVDSTAGAAVWVVTASSTPLASSFGVINIGASTAINTPITVPAVPLGASALAFNGNSVAVLVNGFEQVKGSDVAWSSPTSFTLGIPLYAGDVIVVKP